MSTEGKGRAALGRSEWLVLHSAADALDENGRALEEFVVLASAMLLRYPCRECRSHAREGCGRMLDALPHLRSRAESARLPYRVVAVAWAARFHACVTYHILLRDDGGVVSRASARDALSVAFLGADDVAVADAVAPVDGAGASSE